MAGQPLGPRLTLEEQVAQVVMAVWSGDVDRLAGLVAAGRLGGLFIPPGAFASARALAATLNHLQRLATYPLLVAGQFGAGPGSLPGGGPALPGALALGAARQPDLARRYGALVAAEARAVGINLVLAPVLDVHREPDHLPYLPESFGENPSLVARLGAAFVEGCREGRVLAAAPGFPGRGSAVHDAGRELTILPQNRQALEKIDLHPYAAACRAGLGAITTGHLHVSALDNLPNRLATHSSAVVEGLLRGSLRFRGLVLTDNLDAPAVRVRYTPEVAAVLAFAAGHDLLVTESPEAVYQALYEVVLHSDVPRARLQQAVQRVWAAKTWLGLPTTRFAGNDLPDPAPRAALAREVARAGLTVVRGNRRLLAGRLPLLLAVRAPGVRHPFEADLQALAAHCLAPAPFRAVASPLAPPQVDELLSEGERVEAAVIFVDLPPHVPAVEAAGLCAAVATLVRALQHQALPVAVVLLGNPYALALVDDADLLLHAASDAPACLEAALACLVGHLDPRGRLPVTRAEAGQATPPWARRPGVPSSCQWLSRPAPVDTDAPTGPR